MLNLTILPFTSPPIDDDILFRMGRTFKGGTGLATDAARPWHISMVSKGARRALAAVLMAIEKLRRWPHQIRSVVAVALGKRTGGARLIGLCAALYRIWAKVRYAHCRVLLEARLARPCFAAAPHRGAEKAAFEASLDAEAAASRNLVSAASTVDMHKFYENITVVDFAKGAANLGIPSIIVALTAHIYTGPRMLRVRRAAAPPIFPRKSIIAGCTWATVHVRVMMLAPLDAFV